MNKLIKQIFLSSLLVTCLSWSISAQSISFKSQYSQFSMGNRTGTSETNKPEKICNDFFLENGNSFVGKRCANGDIFINLKLVTSKPLVSLTNGSWSKIYYGYDPLIPSFNSEGTPILSHVVTVSYEKQKDSYGVLLETPNAYKDVSFVWHYFNL